MFTFFFHRWLIFSLTFCLCLFLSTNTVAQNKWDKNQGAFIFGAPSNPVIHWNEVAMELVRDKHINTPEAARLYAMVNAAMYDAVNGIKTSWGLDPRSPAVIKPETDSPWLTSRRAAASSAAFAVLSLLHPDRLTIFQDALDQELEALGGTGFPWIGNGVTWGKSIGFKLVEERSNDGSWPQDIQIGINEPGHFNGDFRSAHFRYLEPFGVGLDKRDVPDAPPQWDENLYLDDLEEVKTHGDIENIVVEPEKAETVKFWRSTGGTARIAGEWIKIAIEVAKDRPTLYSVSETARLFALLTMSMADTIAPVWSAKFKYHRWRPATAIRYFEEINGVSDDGGEIWVPQQGSIGNTPEYVSSKSAMSVAAATVLAGFYCDDFIPFSFTSDKSQNQSKQFESFTQAAQEASISDLYGGIHLRSSIVAGAQIGKKVAQETLTSQLLLVNDVPVGGLCPK